MSARRRSSPLLTLATLIFGLTSCGGGGDDAPVAGPCVVRYAEPSLIISSVQNAATGAAIPVVSLSGITIDGVAFNMAPLAAEARNVRAVGSALECTTACGFTVHEGAIAFTVSAPGFLPRSVAATGAYSSRSGNPGGCPLDLTGGNRINLSLTPG
ncbi:MAG: hypothetical protein ABIR26_03040 [Ramlibacter sp.]